MSDPNDFVDLVTAQSTTEATIIVSLLQAAGINTLRPGANLNDPAASAMKVEGTVGTTVQVAAADRERAQEVLDRAHELGRHLDENPDVSGS